MASRTPLTYWFFLQVRSVRWKPKSFAFLIKINKKTIAYFKYPPTHYLLQKRRKRKRSGRRGRKRGGGGEEEGESKQAKQCNATTRDTSMFSEMLKLVIRIEPANYNGSTLRHHCSPYQIGKNPKVWKHARLASLWGNTHSHKLLWECKIAQSLRKGIWPYLAKLSMYACTFWSRNPLLRIYSKDTLTKMQKTYAQGRERTTGGNVKSKKKKKKAGGRKCFIYYCLILDYCLI